MVETHKHSGSSGVLGVPIVAVSGTIAAWPLVFFTTKPISVTSSSHRWPR